MMNPKITITSLLILTSIAAGACGERETQHKEQTSSSQLHYLYDNNFILKASSTDDKGYAYFKLCVKNQPLPNCLEIFLSENGGQIKFKREHVWELATIINNTKVENMQSSRRKRNRYILKDDFYRTMFYQQGYRAQYPITVIIMELAWYIIDSRLDDREELKWICPVYTTQPPPTIEDTCAPADYIREYHAAEYTSEYW